MSDEETLLWLSKERGLLLELGKLKEVIENANGCSKQADEAEDQTIEIIRKIGVKSLSQWAADRKRQESPSGGGFSKREKKNSFGILG
jgi:hypothetical protein